MDARFRHAFNAAYGDDRYRAYVAAIESRIGTPVSFRLAETPVFLDPAFVAQAERAGYEIVAQLCDPARIARMSEAIPPRWNVPGCDALSTFAIVDFAAADDGGRVVPKLIELQGFPSLLAFTLVQADAWGEVLATMPGLSGAWSSRHGLSRQAMLELGRRTVAGDADPQTVALVDLDPPNQKTYPDFVATKQQFGVDAVDVRALRKRGRTLYRRDPASGREVPVERIYYRLVIDEIERGNVELPFDLRDELDVAWSPHPNWFWTWSKVSLPYLDHPAVPRTRLLSEINEVPRDLEQFVLKPLFSFAGGGVNVAPSRADIDAIPPSARHAWCLQEKVEYGGVLPAVDGGTVKVELRLMFVRPDGDAGFTLVQNLCRLSRGAMIGVDFNRDRTWVGSSVGLLPD